MDKRYLLILFIMMFCCMNLYFISSSSDVIGAASVNVNHYTFSIPEDFTLLNTYDNSVLINNPNTNLFVAVYPLNNQSYDFNSVLMYYMNDTDTKVLSNGTIKVNDITVDSIYYKNYKDSKDNPRNCSVFYFNKDNANFRIEMAGFDYDNTRNETIDTLVFIIHSLRVNYKM